MLAELSLAVALQFGQMPEGNPWWPPVTPPPARYDHPYKGKLIIHEVPRNQLPHECYDALGCTYGDEGGKCVIWLDSMYHDTVRAKLLRHEIAHCNGWPASHPK